MQLAVVKQRQQRLQFSPCGRLAGCGRALCVVHDGSAACARLRHTCLGEPWARCCVAPISGVRQAPVYTFGHDAADGPDAAETPTECRLRLGPKSVGRRTTASQNAAGGCWQACPEGNQTPQCDCVTGARQHFMRRTWGRRTAMDRQLALLLCSCCVKTTGACAR